MAVTGVFNADFASFYTAVDKADQQLQRLATTTGKVSGEASTFSQSYQKVDGVLSAMGVHVGPLVKGMDDIAAAGKKGADGLGLLGTAAAIAGAAMVGWKIGEFIDKMTGASKAIEAATNAVTGWGKALADQTSGAQQDVINRAIAQGAKETISYTEAIKFNAEAFAKLTEQKKNYREILGSAYSEVRKLSDAQKEEIQIAKEAGATTEELTRHFGVSKLALKVLAEEEDKLAASRKAASKAAEERAAAEAKLNAEYAKLMSDVKNANQLAIMEADAAAMTEKKMKAGEGWFNSMQKQVKATNELAEAEKVRVEQNQAEIDGLLKVSEAHEAAGASALEGAAETIAGYQGVQQQVTITGEGLKEYINLMEYTAKAMAILEGGTGLFTTQSQRERIAAIGSGPEGGTLGGLFSGRGSSSSITNNNAFNLVDTADGLARKVSDIIMHAVRSGTQLGTT